MTYIKGDMVVYKDILAEVESVGESAYGDTQLSLVAFDDPEMTCTASAKDCASYNELEFDKEANREAISNARFNSAMTLKMVDGLTDKYFRDGNH